MVANPANNIAALRQYISLELSSHCDIGITNYPKNKLLVSQLSESQIASIPWLSSLCVVRIATNKPLIIWMIDPNRISLHGERYPADNALAISGQAGFNTLLTSSTPAGRFTQIGKFYPAASRCLIYSLRIFSTHSV